MTGPKGRHADEGTSTFYRDLAVMIGGIVLVGAAVFFVLILLADGPSGSTTTTGGQVSTTLPVTSSTPSSEVTTTSSGVSTTTTIPVRPPSEVRVLVLNSMGVAGAAGRLSDELAQGGYQTLPADDYTPEQDPSRIWYQEGFSAEANVLTEFVPGAQVEAIPDPSVGEGADIVIILGTGYEE